MQPREMKAEQESDIRIKGPEERGRQRRIFFSFVSMRNRQSDGGTCVEESGHEW